MRTPSKSNWNRLLLFVTVGLLVFLAACSNGNSGNSKDKVTIKMTYTGDENATKVLKARIDKYLDKSLNIDVQVTAIPGGEYWDKVTTMFAGGTQPDVLFMSEPLKKFASQGKLLDMTSYIDSSSTFKKDDFYPASLQFYQYNGKQYGVPQDLNTALFFYNEDLFKAAGLKTPWESYEEGNWTWDTYLDDAKKLTIKDGDRVTQFGTSYPGIGGWWYSAWVYTNGGMYLNDDNSKSIFTDPKVVGALTFTSELANKYGVAPSPAGGGQDVTGMTFATGKIAMEQNFSWAIGGYKELSFKWNVAPMPVASKDIDPLTTYIHNSGFSISKDTKHPDEAWAVIEALTTPDSYADDAASRGIIPPRPSVVDKKEILNAEGMPSNAKIISQMLQKGKLYQFTETQPEEDQVYSTYGDQILNKKVTPEEGAKKISEEIDAILSKK
ncbi:sugar ABC transporter substrate-binding protein [Paenibacillus sp. OV219]|uniref:ABC transporter substrate-binding protein n=1 Tax=Paenibacillus sp. OV219 TaxID=1884377 RepID=UPI0008BC9A4E|nr:sugar ABC transporter substrate-binding protein [Paenibacillus sp. OV219]SEO67979.1 carbohydrate ABC transporter substrate-binding protein, CUT1 family [Paenibacillus sp. OV219]